MKVIFLDIDGVLNNWTDGSDEHGHIFNTKMVENLRNIIDSTNSKIVISSSWKIQGLDFLRNLWKIRKLPGEILDTTPNVVDIRDTDGYYDLVDRGHEIKQWLLDTEYDIENYCIIDDISDMLPEQMDNFVMTSNNFSHVDSFRGYGLTKICSEKAIEILNKKKC
jgi:hypothetical protein